MSGDVFGNGMLCSEQIRLVAAYDHRHVFIDPDPDAATGFAERKRLFDLAGSSWDDYDRERISEGGGVWPRAAKSIALVAGGARGAGDRGRAAHAQRRHPRDPPGARRPAVERRHRHCGQGVRGDGRGREGPRLGLDPRRRAGPALPGDRRGRQPRPHAPRPGGVRRRRRARQRRLHRQLGRRGLLGPRGQPEDPARAGRARRGARPAGPRRADARGHRRRRRPRPLRLVPAGADPLPGGRDRPVADVRLRGPDGRARGRRPARPRRRGDADARRRWRAAPRGRGIERPELALLLAYAKRQIARDLLAGDFCEDPWLERDLRAYFPDRGGGALRPPARGAPAAARAHRDGQREPGRRTRSGRRSSPSSPRSAARRSPTSSARSGSRARWSGRRRAGTRSRA